MKVRATGDNLVIRLDVEEVERKLGEGQIILAPSVEEEAKSGCQFGTILSIGDGAFDTLSPAERELFKVGAVVVTSRYPGQNIDADPLRSTGVVNQFRLIRDEEVRGLVHESGAEVL